MEIQITDKTKLIDVLYELQDIYGFDIINKAGKGILEIYLRKEK